MAKVVAVKLDLKNFRLWVDAELDGYLDQIPIPAYREIRGEMRAVNPIRGLIPVVFPDDEIGRNCSSTLVRQKISEIERLAQTDGPLRMVMADSLQLLLQNSFQQDMEFRLIVPSSAFTGIVESVRNAILDWSLQLEESGIKGEGMSFSMEDKQLAHSASVTYKIDHIENFTGNMGSVSGAATVHASSSAGIDSAGLVALSEQIRLVSHNLGLPPEQVEILEKRLIDLEDAAKCKQPEPARIKSVLIGIKGILKSGASSLLVHGALREISKFSYLWS